uniref:Uncharacterized protein n=1 Tax=Cacopsylla melanoneura TaxID=428564 RepID=A0A8D8W7R3_9HEMI
MGLNVKCSIRQKAICDLQFHFTGAVSPNGANYKQIPGRRSNIFLLNQSGMKKIPIPFLPKYFAHHFFFTLARKKYEETGIKTWSILNAIISFPLLLKEKYEISKISILFLFG